ncbi:hypothetical protein PG994_009773 [Apiospora phragmitis]|uniref:Uncharacterized protein n=1 Tax=Apiospora phragmitis TaxID=2905665 RepID=A0ABR1U722_9PEZI
MWHYFLWLYQHGIETYGQIDFQSNEASEDMKRCGIRDLIPGSTTAHHIAFRIGISMHCAVNNALKHGYYSAAKAMTPIIIADVMDDCSCECSPNGCSPLITALKRFLTNIPAHDGGASELATRFSTLVGELKIVTGRSGFDIGAAQEYIKTNWVKRMEQEITVEPDEDLDIDRAHLGARDRTMQDLASYRDLWSIPSSQTPCSHYLDQLPDQEAVDPLERHVPVRKGEVEARRVIASRHTAYLARQAQTDPVGILSAVDTRRCVNRSCRDASQIRRSEPLIRESDHHTGFAAIHQVHGHAEK